VLFTANDAYMRDLRIIVLADCVAANTKELNQFAIKQMEQVLKAKVLNSSQLSLDVLVRLVDAGE
jgi:nicotinamidase-related amidase